MIKLNITTKPSLHCRISRHLRGQRREEVKQRLEHTKPSELRAQLSSAAISQDLDASIPSLGVLQKLSSQCRLQHRVNSDPLLDLLERCSSLQPHYVREITVEGMQPVKLLAWLDESVSILKYLSKSRQPIIVGIDSTAAPILPWKSGQGVFYYYAVALHLPRKPDVPPTSLCDFITNRHNTSSIFTSVFRWFFDCILSNSISLAAIITDFNWPTIHALTLALNRMDISAYLDATWKIVQGNANISLTVVALGRSHIFKEFVSWPEIVQQKSSLVRRVWKVAFARIIQAKTMEECRRALERFYMITVCERLSDVQMAVSELIENDNEELQQVKLCVAYSFN
jgi:hypothetical protein